MVGRANTRCIGVLIMVAVLLLINSPRIRFNKWESAYLETPSGRIHYWFTGIGEVILMLHGNSASGRWFTELEPPSGFKLIAPDMPGFGKSDRPGVFDIAFYADSMLSFMDCMGIAEAKLLLGHSLGGLVAVTMASLEPQKFDSLMLANVPYLGKLMVFGDHTERQALYATDDNLLRRALRSLAPTLSDPQLLEMMFDEARAMDPEGFTENPRLLTTYNQPDALYAFKGRVQFLGCSLDNTISSTEVRYNSVLKNGSQYSELEDVGHSPMLEAPKEFMEVITDFIR